LVTGSQGRVYHDVLSCYNNRKDHGQGGGKYYRPVGRKKKSAKVCSVGKRKNRNKKKTKNLTGRREPNPDRDVTFHWAKGGG